MTGKGFSTEKVDLHVSKWPKKLTPESPRAHDKPLQRRLISSTHTLRRRRGQKWRRTSSLFVVLAFLARRRASSLFVVVRRDDVGGLPA